MVKMKQNLVSLTVASTLLSLGCTTTMPTEANYQNIQKQQYCVHNVRTQAGYAHQPPSSKNIISNPT